MYTLNCFLYNKNMDESYKNKKYKESEEKEVKSEKK